FSFILCSILFLQLENQIVKSTTTVGESVFLKCPRDNKFLGSLLWIRLVSGTFPEFLFGTPTINSVSIKNGTFSSAHRITAKQMPGEFVLQIPNVQKSDTAVYYCLKVTQHELMFLSGTFLQVKGKVGKTQLHELRPSVTLRCSVLRPFGNKTCTDEHKVYWFRSGTDEAHPSFIYAHEECQKVKKDSVQKCFYAFSKNLSSSDAGTYSCAVAACGEIFMGRAREFTKKGKHFVFSIINCVLSCVNYFFALFFLYHTDQNADGCDLLQYLIYVLGAALALSVISLAFLIKKSMTQTCFCCRGKRFCTLIIITQGFSDFLIRVEILPWSSSDLYTAIKHDQHVHA
uniref:Ig-like domain-containing protein n=1 Tax=Hippocampus comes TaxID=109280 RepID=A0A3Q3DX86_HIPCM